MAMVAVINNEERIRQIRLRSKSPASKGTAIEPGPLLVLPSGLNLVPKEDWEEAKKNPVVKALLETPIPPSPAPEANPERQGKMILVEGEVVENERPLAKLTVQAACDMVKETLDLTLLSAWLKDEGRSDVRKAIERQLEVINPSATDDKKSKGRNNG